MRPSMHILYARPFTEGSLPEYTEHTCAHRHAPTQARYRCAGTMNIVHVPMHVSMHTPCAHMFTPSFRQGSVGATHAARRARELSSSQVCSHIARARALARTRMSRACGGLCATYDAVRVSKHPSKHTKRRGGRRWISAAAEDVLRASRGACLCADVCVGVRVGVSICRHVHGPCVSACVSRHVCRRVCRHV